MEENKLQTNYSKYIQKLGKYISDECISKLIENCPNLQNVTFANNVDSGLAYDGSLIDAVFSLTAFACHINSMLPEQNQVDVNSIVKVGLLSHISKVQMFEPNQNSWEKTNRGLMYSFVKLPAALRTGERSLQICNNCGITFTPEEFEAMRIIDKDSDNDAFTKLYSSGLSIIIKQANELVMLINRKNV